MSITNHSAILPRVPLLPDIARDEILPTKLLIEQYSEISRLSIINANPNRPIVGQ